MLGKKVVVSLSRQHLYGGGPDVTPFSDSLFCGGILLLDQFSLVRTTSLSQLFTYA